MIPDLNIFSTVTRTLVKDGLGFVVEDEDNGKFMASLQLPQTSRITDGSPREGSVYVLRWRAGPLGPSPVPQAGWRVSLIRPTSGRTYENQVYELLGDPREIRNGANSTGMQASVLPVIDLYPYEASLTEQDSTEVIDLVVALWSEREDHLDTGTYEDFTGEAPVEHADAIKMNRRLVIGGDIYRITSAIVDFEGPRVKFNVRRAGG